MDQSHHLALIWYYLVPQLRSASDYEERKIIRAAIRRLRDEEQQGDSPWTHLVGYIPQRGSACVCVCVCIGGEPFLGALAGEIFSQGGNEMVTKTGLMHGPLVTPDI